MKWSSIVAIILLPAFITGCTKQAMDGATAIEPTPTVRMEPTASVGGIAQGIRLDALGILSGFNDVSNIHIGCTQEGFPLFYERQENGIRITVVTRNGIGTDSESWTIKRTNFVGDIAMGEESLRLCGILPLAFEELIALGLTAKGEVYLLQTTESGAYEAPIKAMKPSSWNGEPPQLLSDEKRNAVIVYEDIAKGNIHAYRYTYNPEDDNKLNALMDHYSFSVPAALLSCVGINGGSFLYYGRGDAGEHIGCVDMGTGDEVWRVELEEPALSTWYDCHEKNTYVCTSQGIYEVTAAGEAKRIRSFERCGLPPLEAGQTQLMYRNGDAFVFTGDAVRIFRCSP